MDLAYIEGLLEYAFQDRSYLLEALHAPGSGLDRVGNRAIPDGNRRLAMLGDAVIKSVILDGWYSTQEERAKAQGLLSRVGEAQFQAEAARNVGLDTLIVVNQAQRGLPPSNVLLKATMNAVIGAVWVDAQRDVPTIQALIQKLRYVEFNLMED